MLTQIPGQVMEYCPEVAVLQSALVLAESKVEDGLAQYTLSGGDRPAAVNIVVYAVEEICRGFECRRTSSEAENWKHTVTALLTHLLLHYDDQHHDGRSHYDDQQHYDAHTNDEIDEKSDAGIFDAVLVGMPQINTSFYYDLISQYDSVFNLNKLINAMDQETGHKLLLELVAVASVSLDRERSLNFVLAILEYICLVSNPFIETLPTDRSGLMEILQFLTKHSTKMVYWSPQHKARCILSLLNLLKGFLTGSTMLLGLQEMRHAEKTIKLSLPQGTILNLVDIDTDLPWLMCNIPGQNSQVVNVLVETLNHVLKPGISGPMSKTSLGSDSAADKAIDTCFSGFFLDVGGPCIAPNTLLCKILHPDLVKPVCRKVFLSNSMCLNEIADEAISPLVEEETKAVLKSCLISLSPLLEVLKTYQTAEMLENEKPKKKMEQALHMINHRMKGFECMCEWMSAVTDTDVLHDPRWMACVKDNLELFTCGLHAYNLLDRLSHLDESPLLQQLSQVYLDLFTALPVLTQNEVLIKVHCPLSSLFRMTSCEENREGELTTLFNQLVSHNDQVIPAQLVSAVARLALHSPEGTISKLVQCAVCSHAQTQVMIQVLSQLPSLSRLHHSDQPSLLLLSLHQQLHQSLTSKQRSNAKNFCRGLLEFGSSQEEASTLIPHHSFLKHCVFPFLINDESNWSTHLPITLQLLDVTIETLTKLNPDWSVLKECSLLPLVVYLGQMIEKCSYWMEDGDESIEENLTEVKVRYKEECVIILTHLVRLLEEYKTDIAVAELKWLCGLFVGIQPLLILHICPLIDDYIGYMESLVPDLEKNLATKGSIGADVFVMLLDVGKMNTAGLDLIKSRPDLTSIKQDSDAMPHLLLALMQVLVNATTSEWVNIFSLIHHLLEVKYIQPLDQTINSSAIGCSGVLCQALLLLTDHLPHPHPVWPHLAAAYISTIKSACLGEIGISASSINLLMLFVNIINLQNSLPSICSPLLEVLALDILSLMQNLPHDFQSDLKIIFTLENVVAGVKHVQSRDVYEKSLEKIRSSVESDQRDVETDQS